MSKKGVTLTVGNDTLYTKPYYPVGAIIYNANANYNPNGDLIGTWQQIKDVFLLACGNTYKNGATGGEATHKLTINEIPNHMHLIYATANPNTGGFGTRGTFNGTEGEGLSAYSTGVSTGGSGGDTAHNNMPPYRAVYVWERIS